VPFVPRGADGLQAVPVCRRLSVFCWRAGAIGLGWEGTTEGLTVLIRDAGVPRLARNLMVAWTTMASGWAARAALIAIVTWIQRTGPSGYL
jgi:hypothetical protein